MTKEQKNDLLEVCKSRYPKGTILFFPNAYQKEYESLGEFYALAQEIRVKVVGGGSVWCCYEVIRNNSIEWAETK